MYTREDEDQARQLWKKRLGLGRGAGSASSSTRQMSAETASRSSSARVTVSTSGNFASAVGVISPSSENMSFSCVSAAK